MEKKGLVTHTRKGLTHLYKPAVTKQSVTKPILRQILRDLFSGKPSAAMQALLGEGEVSADELAEMRRLIDEASHKRPR
jgi:predicted transcriptional regulator